MCFPELEVPLLIYFRTPSVGDRGSTTFCSWKHWYLPSKMQVRQTNFYFISISISLEVTVFLLLIVCFTLVNLFLLQLQVFVASGLKLLTISCFFLTIWNGTFLLLQFYNCKLIVVLFNNCRLFYKFNFLLKASDWSLFVTGPASNENESPESQENTKELVSEKNIK